MFIYINLNTNTNTIMNETRQEYNKKILAMVKDADWMTDQIYDKISERVEWFPDQRWGQLMTNYIIPDYRMKRKCTLTDEVMHYFGWNTGDPFYDESSKTYKELLRKNDYPEPVSTFQTILDYVDEIREELNKKPEYFRSNQDLKLIQKVEILRSIVLIKMTNHE